MNDIFKKLMFTAIGIGAFIVYAAIVFFFFSDTSNYLTGDPNGSLLMVALETSLPMFAISFIVGLAIYDYSTRRWLDTLIYSPGGLLTIIDIIRNPLRYRIMGIVDAFLITSFVICSILGIYLGLKIRDRSITKKTNTVENA